MRVSKTKSKGFIPFDITLSVESEEEARALYAIFNYVPNLDLFPEGVGASIRDKIGGEFEALPCSGEIAGGITYSTFYNSKKE